MISHFFQLFFTFSIFQWIKMLLWVCLQNVFVLWLVTNLIVSFYVLCVPKNDKKRFLFVSLLSLQGAPPKPQRAYSSGTARSGADGAGARAAAPDRFAQFAQRPNNSLYNIPGRFTSAHCPNNHNNITTTKKPSHPQPGCKNTTKKHKLIEIWFKITHWHL